MTLFGTTRAVLVLGLSMACATALTVHAASSPASVASASRATAVAESSPEDVLPEHEDVATFYERRAALTQWVYDTVPEREVHAILKHALTEQDRLNQTADPAKDLAQFACVAPNAPTPSAQAQATFERAASSPDSEASALYARAAAEGHWRAAARLISRMMDDEDWESAQPVIAWLLHQKVPSGWNKLADLLQATSSYDGASTSDLANDFILGLRWRAAQAGDPVAQITLARLLEKEGEPKIAAALTACAKQHNEGL